MADPVVRVLFVCLGNICRSPMAEAVFRHLVEEAGLSDQILIGSAGTGSWHVGESAHHGTLNVLRKNNIVHNGRARQISRADFDQYDYILAMDEENLADLCSLKPANSRAELGLFLDYAGDQVPTHEVPDPYYTGRFEDVYKLVRTGAEALLRHVRQEHSL